MATAFLIDGYNLIHALGFLCGKAAPGELEEARLRLLDLLKAKFGGRAGDVTVVFDTSHGSRTPQALDHGGIHVYFSPAGQEADDLIEEFIRRSSAPKDLKVVSSDHRLQKAARRRHAVAMGCLEFMDWLERRRQSPHADEEGNVEKDIARAGDDRLLQEFKEADDDLRRLSDPYGFEEPNARE
jgi:predicted RNA-binding protein with PIN domain